MLQSLCMAGPRYKMIRFPSFDTKNGVLCMFQEGPAKHELPFTPKRVLIIKGMRGKNTRGAHAHKKTRQILCAVNGGCALELEDARGKKTIVLSRPDEGVFLYPQVWHVMSAFKPKTVLLMVADRCYDEKDYIRSYDEFRQIAGRKA